MPNYEKPTKTLMTEWASQHLVPNQIFTKAEPVRWFAEHFPKTRSTTVTMHVDGMSTNNLNRRHHPSIKPGSGHDLFYKLNSSQYRLYAPETDPKPLYKETIEKGEQPIDPGAITTAGETEDEEEYGAKGASEFAFERDLQNYLVKNLHMVEPGLRLYEDEGISGVQYPVGGRFIDILAVDHEGKLVVIELKVSRSYDRVIGQLLRYMGWVERNIDGAKQVRGVIVANEISEDLKLACSRIPDVRLIEYKIAFSLRRV
ncbi:endonuclease NucS domain-containing protein [Bradyrhizobium sp. CCBAU 53338]|uniref:endonuclease NucS domain-containing protein n=1 Tax=Bradyrhizobium sp. CCBAU 53338 TaxID=1325111 RepID=UPI00188C3A75|nr:endonuclease NucS domain-containing protein [Bradyrhizobium sp. CCBAU 53338]QOZ55153.1 DUF91 domain-containing protein [Bradyrhizobium sp. CCBAU 53338]